MTSILTEKDQSINLVNKELYETIARLKEQANSLNPRYGLLWDAIEKLIKSGGKRFRPYMSILSYRCFTDNDYQKIIPVVASQELLHLALLIHDDIIDRDYVRYKIDNISGQYFNNYSRYLSEVSEIRHYSDSAALLAGDLLLSESFQMLIAKAPEKHISDLMKIYQRSIFYVAGGELLDTESAFIADINNSIKIAEMKTAYYSFVTPLLIGATLADADENSKTLLQEIGLDLGVAYQLLDDELGVFGDESVTGKSNSSDLKEAKKTYMVNEFDKIASEPAKLEFYGLFGDTKMSNEEASRLRQLLTDSGAKQKNRDKIENLKTSIKSKINELNILESRKETLLQLVAITLERNN